MNTIEGNKLIAEFHRGKYNPNAIYLYHDRWDELMPVVEKICCLKAEKEGVGITIFDIDFIKLRCSLNYRTKYKGAMSKHKYFENVGDDALYITIIQFIEWYNKEQSVKESDTSKAT